MEMKEGTGRRGNRTSEGAMVMLAQELKSRRSMWRQKFEKCLLGVLHRTWTSAKVGEDLHEWRR